MAIGLDQLHSKGVRTMVGGKEADDIDFSTILLVDERRDIGMKTVFQHGLSLIPHAVIKCMDVSIKDTSQFWLDKFWPR